MHDPYDDEDDGYDDEHYNYDYNDQYDPYKFYFKFDVGGTPLSDWLQEMINKWIGPNAFINLNQTWDMVNVSGFPTKKFPVNYADSNTGKGNSLQYLGSNSYNEPIWKKKYFARDDINDRYKKHIIANAKHFLTQPNYYKSLFDILN